MAWTFEEMDRMFNPQVVAVVGDKKDRGYNWLNNVLTLKGRIYSVQVDETEIPGIEALGVPNYKSLTEIPEPVDYVLVTVPRSVSPLILDDAIKAKVNSVMFFTSGFAETETSEGIRLQQLLTEKAQRARMKLVGPNCMGIFNPRIGLRHSVEQHSGESGTVGFISQSGTHAILFTQTAYQHGIKVSKSVSMGNGIILHAIDYLEYLAEDPETELIAMYLEAVPDGRRLFNLLKEVIPRKPVIIWKGGQTEEGARAAQSHTASLAASYSLWCAMARQSGAILVDSFAELIDVVKGLLFIRAPHGPRMGLVATTGGQSVVVTDAFSKAGLQVPQLTESSYQEYGTFFNTVGGSYRNPLDMSPNSRDPNLILRILRILEQDQNVDAVCYEMNVGLGGRRPEVLQRLVEMAGICREEFIKPFFCVLTAGHREKEAIDVRQSLAGCGVVSFPTFEQAALTYRRLLDYSVTRNEQEG